jgi:hypothetical protein
VRFANDALTPRKKKIALAIAALADAIQIGLFPAFLEGVLSIPDDVLDVVVAALLLVTLGWSWRIAAALVAELTPGLALFPSWTAFVITMPTSREPLPQPAKPPPRLPH